MLDARSIYLALALLAPGCAITQPAAPSGPIGKAHVETRDAPPSDGKVRSERISVAFGDVHQLASLLQQTLTDGTRTTGPVRAVLVDERTGELVVFGTDEGIARVKAFLSPGVLEDGRGDIAVLALTHAGAEELLHLVQPLCTGGARIVADPATNSIIVSGTADARACVQKAVTALDVERTQRSEGPRAP